MVGHDCKQHVEALKKAADRAAVMAGNEPKLTTQMKQLKAIERTIRQLTSSGVPVPESLMDESRAISSDIDAAKPQSGETRELYESLLEIIERLGLACGRTPHRDLIVRSRERRKDETPPETLRQAIIGALQELGGEASAKGVVAKIQADLTNRFTSSDLERPNGSVARWQTNVRKERKRMIKDGLLTPASKGQRWTLAGP